MRKVATVLVTIVLLAGFVGTAGADFTGAASQRPAGVGDLATDEHLERGVSADRSNETARETETQPSDPDEDVLGWENGYWYNETVSVDRSDGLNETELDTVVARSMARVEKVRQIEFEKTVPVEVISREEYQANYTGTYNYTVEDRLHQNVKWEAMLMVNQTTDAISVREQNRGATVGGFYSPSEERIVIVSENTTSPKMNEITLSQELFHALQDQKFNLSSFDYSNQEAHNAADGVVEGDGNLVDQLYEDRCGTGWDCLMPQDSSGGGGAADIHVGMYLVTFQPYSDGPPFVYEIYQEEGWEGVNDLYENPPESTEQVIHPEKYGEDEPSMPEVDHSPTGDWQVLEMGEGSVDYAVFGEAGLNVMLYYPSFVESRKAGVPSSVIIPYQHFFNEGASEDPSVSPYNYAHPLTAGWDGDKLVPYVKGEPSNDSETGYVWKTNWDSEEDAEEFVDGYTQLLQYYEAQQLGENVWSIPQEKEFADAFGVVRNGKTVTIVNGPTVESLTSIHQMEGLAVPEETTTTVAMTEESTSDTTTAATSGDETTTESSGGAGPGFGFGAALLALVAAVGATLITRRR